MASQSFWYAGIFSGAMLLAGWPAHACIVAQPFDVTDVRYADVVVVGRISNYEKVLDPVIREQRRKALEGDLHPTVRKTYEEQTAFLSDYAKFDVIVEEVLAGKAGDVIQVAWDNSSFGEPDSLPDTRYLVAINIARPASERLPAKDVIILYGNAEPPDSNTVLQAPCAPPFLIEATSEDAIAARELLSRW